MDLGLRNKNVLITGSTAGIGRRIANLFADEGQMLLFVPGHLKVLMKAVKEISLTADGRIIGAPCNIKDKDSYESWVEDMVEQLGGVDIFIPNVSAGRGNDSERNWWNNFEVDVLGTVRGVKRAVLPHMEEKGGAINDLYDSCY